MPLLDQGVSSYVISSGNFDIMIDCGEGTYLEWLKNNYKWERLRYIFITHMHPDHTGGLINFLFYKKLSKIDNPIIIYGPRILEEYILICLKYQSINLNFNYEFIPITSNLNLRDDIKVKSAEMQHGVKCWTYRFNSDNIDIMITTDTLPNKKTIKLANRCGILIHECTFLDDNIELANKTKHTTLNQVLDIAKQAKVDRLILSHFSKEIKKEKIDNIYYNNKKCVVYNERIMINE